MLELRLHTCLISVLATTPTHLFIGDSPVPSKPSPPWSNLHTPRFYSLGRQRRSWWRSNYSSRRIRKSGSRQRCCLAQSRRVKRCRRIICYNQETWMRLRHYFWTLVRQTPLRLTCSTGIWSYVDDRMDRYPRHYSLCRHALLQSWIRCNKTYRPMAQWIV